MSTVSLQMSERYRQIIISEHCFYVEQTRKRLLSQFENISSEVERAIEMHYKKVSVFYNPDAHDVGDFYESAIDHGNEFGQLLCDKHDDTRLGIIAGMYHQWEKKLKEWLLQEMRHWSIGQNVNNSIWKQDFSQIVCLLESFGFYPKQLPAFDLLNAMRLVVNVFKHGDGKSFDDLKESYPDFVPGLLKNDGFGYLNPYLNYSNMQVTDNNLDSFSEAILEFWQEIPADLIITEEIDAPTWFEKAYIKDSREQ